MLKTNERLILHNQKNFDRLKINFNPYFYNIQLATAK